jgi:glycosyltransferase involved in cell wall biosynthesis
MKRMRAAVIVPGGVGAGDFSQGYPPMMIFLDKLFESFDLTVYSLHAVNAGFESSTYQLKSPPHFIKSPRLRVLFLVIRFMFDQLCRPHHILHGFWVYPAGTLTVILGKIFRIPSIVTVQGGEAAGFPQIGYGNMLHKRLRKITLWTCEKATCLNSISSFLVDQLKFHGLKRDDAVVIPFGSALTQIKPIIEVEPELRILHVANLTQVKDQKTLVKAFSIIASKRTATLTIIGGDYMNGEIQRFTAEQGLSSKVKFLGSLPHHELLPYYFQSHIMMHTSFHEGQSGVVTDAMARGVVICGTRVGIIADLGEAYCQVAAVGDYVQLASLTLQIWDDSVLYHRKRMLAWEWSQAHDDDWTVSEYVTLYNALIAKNEA